MQQITSADLATQTTPDLDGFMRHVFDLQVQMWTSQGVPYVHELPGNELANLPASDTAGRAVQLRRNVAAIVHNMLEAARRDLSAARASGDPTARGVRRLAVKSGYRSAPTQLSIWERMFPRYYRETQTQRQAMTGGAHGPEAARFLANYFNVRVHSPGYSQHQRGQTVDLTFDQRGWIEPDSDPANITRWRNSWFFGWLSSHAWEYGFVQNPTLNEPWHWEFEEGLYMLSMLVQQIEQLIRRIVELIRNIAGALGRSDERPTQQSG